MTMEKVRVQVVGVGWVPGEVVSEELIARCGLSDHVRLTVRHARGEFCIVVPPQDRKTWKWPGIERAA
jgi:hypothetical protein